MPRTRRSPVRPESAAVEWPTLDAPPDELGGTAAVYQDPKVLKPWDRNPRINDATVAKLANLIKTTVFGAPIVARVGDHRIIAGHARHAAALRLGLDLVPVRYVVVDDATADAMTLADNKLQESSKWDDTQLASLLQEIRVNEFDLSGLGFSGQELSRLLAPSTPALPTNPAVNTPREIEGGIDEVLAGSKRWALLHDDSSRVLRSMAANSIDAVITDPPYSSGGQFRSDRAKSTDEKYIGGNVKIQRNNFVGDNRDQRSFVAWASIWIAECVRVLKPGGVFAAFVDWRQLPAMSDAIQAGGVVWRGVVAWDKLYSRPVLGRFTNQCEYVLWGSKGAMPLRPELGTMRGCFAIPRDEAAKVHQTGKPVPLMRQLCRVVPLDGVVLDPFNGSGSTGVGALLEGRRYIGVEEADVWYDYATKRLREYPVEDGGSAPLDGSVPLIDDDALDPEDVEP